MKRPLDFGSAAGRRQQRRLCRVPENRAGNGFFVGDRFVEPARNRVSHGDESVSLEPKAMSVLVYLAARAGEVVSGDEILRDLWADTVVNDDSVYWYIARIRRALGDSPKRQQVIETVPKKGYALRAPVFAESSSMLPGGGDAAGITAASLPGDGLSLFDGVVEQHSVAVLPLTDLGGVNGAFCEGLTEELRHVLSGARGLRVAGHVSTGNIRDRHLDPRVIGRLLNVTHVVDGSVRREGERLRISARLLDARDGTQRWSEIYERRWGDSFRIQREVAAAVADALQVSLLPVNERELASSYTANRDAWEFFMLGRHEWTYRSAGGPEPALHWFRKAADLDPDFALAQAGLAAAHAVMPWYRQADRDACYRAALEAAERSLTLAPELADAHAAMGFIAMNYDLDGAAAGRWLEGALRLKPSCAQARHWYADLLNALGRHDEALVQAELAARVEPLSALFQVRIGRILDDAGRAREATPAYHRALELAPLNAVVHVLAGLHFLRIRDLERARRRFERWADLDPGIEAGIGDAVVRGIGQPGRCDAAVARVVALQPLFGILPMVRTALLLELGALDAAAETVRQTAAAGLLSLPWVLVMPGMERLAGDPRVAALRRPGQLPGRPTHAAALPG